MSNTEFSATNGENTAQNALNTQSANGALDSEQNTAQGVATQEQKSIKLSEFLQSSEGKGLPTNDKGQFMPDKKQLKMLVNCIDDSTGKLISLAKIDTSKVTNMKALFYKSDRVDFSGIEEWNVSNVTGFELCFAQCRTFNAPIEKWGDKIKNARTFEKMFWNAEQFNRPIGAHWDTQSATNMIGMFSQTKNFNNGGVPFGEKWKMDKVQWTWQMFWNAEKFNQPLNEWKMSSVTKCFTMFMNAKAFNQPLDKWDLSNAIDMSHMFSGAESFNQNLSAWGDKLGKVRNMTRMFANTKALTTDFLGAWKIPENCDTENIIKGSALETTDKSKITTIITNNTVRENVFDRCKISQIQTSEKNKIQSLKLRENKDFLGEWIPKNILENDYKVFLAKIKDKIKDNDENSGEEKFSFNDLEQGDYDKWDFAFYEVFDCWFLVEKDDKELSDIKKCTGNSFAIGQSFDWDESDKRKAQKYDNNLKIFFDSKEISILANNLTKSKDILAVLNAYILAKAYNTKMQELGNIARKANEMRRKIKESASFRDKMPFISKARKTNKAVYKELKKSYEKFCNFDLHSYHNIPITQSMLDDRSLIEIWQQISKTYMIQETHKELNTTIAQITELVSNERQEDLNFIMRWVAGLSAIAAFFAAVPVIKDLGLWIVSKFQ